MKPAVGFSSTLVSASPWDSFFRFEEVLTSPSPKWLLAPQVLHLSIYHCASIPSLLTDEPPNWSYHTFINLAFVSTAFIPDTCTHDFLCTATLAFV
ncbi:hypothetical protein BDR04DRAFT_1100588 [Suillus decipiens]|nr:hypothetical protein BDR04DRAFT_1100588 [Suillus decipiens]